MDSKDIRLSRISTLWPVVRQAHEAGTEDAQSAQKRLIERYGGAVRRYLLAALRDIDAADELSQEFALRIMLGRFRRADPQRGRFRDFLKTALFHMIVDYQRLRQKRSRQLVVDPADSRSDHPDLFQDDEAFLRSWREELLWRSWQALEKHSAETAQALYTVLRFRAEHPETRSAQIAEQLGPRLGRTLTAPGVRQTLHRAREKFAALLLEEVTHSLHEPTPENVEQELIDLNLLEYCRPLLEPEDKKK